jgi:CheY-like chemotaxis protein
LSAWGVEVFAGSTVEDALTQLSQAGRHPDIVIADYRLSGGLTGIHAVATIRAAFGQALAAIVITGDTSPRVTEAIRASGCRLAHKPIVPQALRRLIDELLTSTENDRGGPATEYPIDQPAEKLEQV